MSSFIFNTECIGCGNPHAINCEGMPSLLQRFCMTCCQDLGIDNEADAQEVFMFWKHHGSGRQETAPEPKQGKTKSEKAPAKPAVDPAKVLVGVRAQCDYKVGPVPEYTKPITYVCAKNGLFEVRESELVRVITQPKEVLGLGPETVMQPGIQWKLPKIPFLFLQQTISFFRGVEARLKGSNEALIQVWWNHETQQHEMHIPEQQVSGGGVRHNSVLDQENSGRLIHVMDIHSHGTNMSAFWSGVDNADEVKIVSERFFGVIGKISQPIPEMKFRMRTRGEFVDLTMADVFDLENLPELDFRVSPDLLWRTMADPTSIKDGHVRLWCPVEPFANVEVPAAWYEKVKSYGWNNRAGHSSIGYGYTGGHGHQRQLPSTIKGLIYIDGEEWEVDGQQMKKTGKKLLEFNEIIKETKGA